MGNQSVTEEEHLTLPRGLGGSWRHQGSLAIWVNTAVSGPVATITYCYDKAHDDNCELNSSKLSIDFMLSFLGV